MHRFFSKSGSIEGRYFGPKIAHDAARWGFVFVGAKHASPWAIARL
jgi:hypothetical protein